MDRAQSGIRFNKAFGDTVNWDLIPTDAAGAVVAGRPEQRPLLVVPVASRLEVVVYALAPTPCQGEGCSSLLECAHTGADGSAPCTGDHIHDDRCSDRH